MAKKGRKIQNIGLSLFPQEVEDSSGKIITTGDEKKSSIQKIELTSNGKLPADIIARRLKERTIPHEQVLINLAPHNKEIKKLRYYH